VCKLVSLSRLPLDPMRSFGILPCLGISILSMAWVPLASQDLPAPSPRRNAPSAPVRDSESILQTLQQQALPDLIGSLTEKKPHTRLRVTRIVGDVHDHEACEYLVKAYEQTSAEGVRCKILESIGKFHDRAQRQWLSERLGDPHISIQCFAVWALGELRDPQADDILRQKLWSSNHYVQMTAIDALGKMDRNSSVALEVGVFLRDDDVQMRFLAAKALYNVAGPESLAELEERLLQEPSVDVQEILARTLGHAGDVAGAARLIDLLKNAPSQATEHWAEVGLRAVRPAVLIPALTPLMEGKDFRLKVAAARVLSELDLPILQDTRSNWMERVMRWAQGPDLVVRAAAIRLLERMKATP